MFPSTCNYLYVAHSSCINNSLGVDITSWFVLFKMFLVLICQYNRTILSEGVRHSDIIIWGWFWHGSWLSEIIEIHRILDNFRSSPFTIPQKMNFMRCQWLYPFNGNSLRYPPETNKYPLNIEGWKMKFPFGMTYFQGRTVRFGECIFAMILAWSLLRGFVAGGGTRNT